MRACSVKPNFMKRATLVGVTSTLAVLGSAAAVTPASAASNAQLATAQPMKWSQTETLSGAACAALNRQHPGVAPNCQVHLYVTGEKGLPVSPGTHLAAAKDTAATSYGFDYTFRQCGLSCSVWQDSFEVHGWYNGSHVYKTGSGVNNTASTNGPSARTTWTGVRDNGGAAVSNWPDHAMQFGEDAEITFISAAATLTDETWQRVWVDVYGTWFDRTEGTYPHGRHRGWSWHVSSSNPCAQRS